MIGQFIHRRLLLPLFESGFKCRKTLRYWKELERTQWLSKTQLEAMQLEALRNLLDHAARNCPYYRNDWLARGLNPQKLQSLSDFSAWPMTDRETMHAHRLTMRAPGIKLISKSTGGSSGSPLHFDLDRDSNDRRMAAWHRGYSWAGAEPGTRQFYLWGVPLSERSILRRCKDRAYDWLYRRRVFSSFAMDAQHEEAFVRKLNRARPEVLVAYVNPLYELARSLKERHGRPHAPRAIVVGAEKLHDFQRRLIEQVFAAPVFETYGSREFMLIAAQCDRHDGLHLTSEHLLVEILDDDGNPTPAGEEGNVVITDLYNYGMPFIRYANGDRAVAGEANCPCGRGLPLLREITGRQLDVLTTPDGRRIAGEFFPHLVKDFAAIRRFQVIQEYVDRVSMRVVLNAPLPQEDRRTLESAARRELGPRVRFDLQVVDDIPLTPAGKLQVVVNHLRIAHDAAALEHACAA